MKVEEIPLKKDFTLAFCLFLDDFYRSEWDEKNILIRTEPMEGILEKEQYCMLAAAVHKLANDAEIEIPLWVFNEKYIMPYPVYAYGTKKREIIDILEELTPVEYKIRNLYYGNRVLKRC